MEEAVERIKKIVADYRPDQKGSDERTMRALLAAVSHCRKYIDDHSQTDKGCAQRIVRDLHEVLAELPTFRAMVGDKASANKLHTRKLAEGQLGLIHDHIKHAVREHDQEKTKVIHDWVAEHPVFGQLKPLLIKKLPKTAYVLLFKLRDNDELELVTHTAEDGRIFTRIRPQEFRDDLRLHKTYQRIAIVGAAVINEKELVGVVARVPPPTEKKDQLQALLSVSSEAAGRPARQFVEGSEVLNALHELARQRKMPKESYVLLFEAADAEGSPHAETDMVAAGESPQEEPEESAENMVAAGESPQEEPEESGLTPAGTEDGGVEEPPSEPAPALKIIVKQGQDGKVISRFWPSDFAIRHKLFDMFKGKAPVLGAAVIREKELLNVIGHVPQPAGGQSPIEALLQASWHAVERPYVEFVNQHEVLKGLFNLSHGEMRSRDVSVVLFTLTENGRLEVLRLGRDRRQTARVPLSHFQNAKALHDRFANRSLVGASVLSEDTRERDQRGGFRKHGDRNRENRRRDDSRDREGQDRENKGERRHDKNAASQKPVVLAAFGRTPLKVNILATPDTFRRLGLEID